MQQPLGISDNLNASRGSSLVDDCIYFIDINSKVRCFDISKLLQCSLEQLVKVKPSLKFVEETADIAYRNKFISYLTTGGVIYRTPVGRPASKKNIPQLKSMDVTTCSEYQLALDATFRCMISSKRETVVSSYSPSKQTTGLFVLSDQMSLVQAFYIRNQASPVNYLKLLIRARFSYSIGLTADSHLHIISTWPSGIEMVMRDHRVDTGVARGVCILSDQAIVVYGSYRAVAVDLGKLQR